MDKIEKLLRRINRKDRKKLLILIMQAFLRVAINQTLLIEVRVLSLFSYSFIIVCIFIKSLEIKTQQLVLWKTYELNQKA